MRQPYAQFSANLHADLRVRRLKRHVAAKLLPIFDKRATEQIAMPLGAAATPS